jgi:hypothetical protein
MSLTGVKEILSLVKVIYPQYVYNSTKDRLVVLLLLSQSILSPNRVTSSAAKRKMLAVNFNAAETDVNVACNLHAPCAGRAVSHNTYNFDDVTVFAANTATPHVGASLNYA